VSHYRAAGHRLFDEIGCPHRALGRKRERMPQAGECRHKVGTQPTTAEASKAAPPFSLFRAVSLLDQPRASSVSLALPSYIVSIGSSSKMTSS